VTKDLGQPALLTAIVPLTRMVGRLENLRSWINLVAEYSIQLIIIHDVQDEATSAELRKLISDENCQQIELVEDFFGAPGLARNAGVDLAKGNWVTFWDSDDVPQVHKVMSMLNSFNDVDVECVIGGYSTVNELSGEVEEIILPMNFLESIALNPGIWRFAFKRKSLGGLRFSNLLMAEDQLFLAEYEVFTRKIATYDHSVYNYYVGGNFHLTQQQKALKHILLSVEETFKILRRTSDLSFHFVSILLWRQIATGVRHLGLSARVKMIRILLRGMYNLPRNRYPQICRAFCFTFKNMRNAK